MLVAVSSQRADHEADPLDPTMERIEPALLVQDWGCIHWIRPAGYTALAQQRSTGRAWPQNFTGEHSPGTRQPPPPALNQAPRRFTKCGWVLRACIQTC